MNAPGRHLLQEFLRNHGESAETFAPKVQAHRSQIYRALSGDRRPGIDLAARIERATGGVVPAASWSPVPRRRGTQAVTP